MKTSRDIKSKFSPKNNKNCTGQGVIQAVAGMLLGLACNQLKFSSTGLRQSNSKFVTFGSSVFVQVKLGEVTVIADSLIFSFSPNSPSVAGAGTNSTDKPWLSKVPAFNLKVEFLAAGKICKANALTYYRLKL